MTFSGSRSPLTVEDIGRAVFERALPHAPLEIALPAHRGAMAKFGSLFPGASVGLLARLRELGRARQQQRRRS